MAQLEILDDHLLVRFSRTEQAVGLVNDLRVPLSAVSAVKIVQSWSEVRGARMGVALRGVWLFGTWRSPGRRQLVALRRDRPAVHVWLRDQKFDELLVSTPKADLLRTRLADVVADGERKTRRLGSRGADLVDG